jgi:hypothetical protein
MNESDDRKVTGEMRRMTAYASSQASCADPNISGTANLTSQVSVQEASTDVRAERARAVGTSSFSGIPRLVRGRGSLRRLSALSNHYSAEHSIPDCIEGMVKNDAVEIVIAPQQRSSSAEWSSHIEPPSPRLLAHTTSFKYYVESRDMNDESSDTSVHIRSEPPSERVRRATASFRNYVRATEELGTDDNGSFVSEYSSITEPPSPRLLRHTASFSSYLRATEEEFTMPPPTGRPSALNIRSIDSDASEGDDSSNAALNKRLRSSSLNGPRSGSRSGSRLFGDRGDRDLNGEPALKLMTSPALVRSESQELTGIFSPSSIPLRFVEECSEEYSPTEASGSGHRHSAEDANILRTGDGEGLLDKGATDKTDSIKEAAISEEITAVKGLNLGMESWTSAVGKATDSDGKAWTNAKEEAGTDEKDETWSGTDEKFDGGAEDETGTDASVKAETGAEEGSGTNTKDETWFGDKKKAGTGAEDETRSDAQRKAWDDAEEEAGTDVKEEAGTVTKEIALTNAKDETYSGPVDKAEGGAEEEAETGAEEEAETGAEEAGSGAKEKAGTDAKVKAGTGPKEKAEGGTEDETRPDAQSKALADAEEETEANVKDEAGTGPTYDSQASYDKAPRPMVMMQTVSRRRSLLEEIDLFLSMDSEQPGGDGMRNMPSLDSHGNLLNDELDEEDAESEGVDDELDSEEESGEGSKADSLVEMPEARNEARSEREEEVEESVPWPCEDEQEQRGTLPLAANGKQGCACTIT